MGPGTKARTLCQKAGNQVQSLSLLEGSNPFWEWETSRGQRGLDEPAWRSVGRQPPTKVQWEGAGSGLPGKAQGGRWESTAQKPCSCEIFLLAACLLPHPQKVKQNPNKSLTRQILIP